jgi:hypothetical protein
MPVQKPKQSRNANSWLKEVRAVFKPYNSIDKESEKIIAIAPDWARKIVGFLEGSLSRAYNLKVGESTATNLGIIAGHLDSCSQIDFAILAKVGQPSAKLSKVLKGLPDAVRPMQKAEGKLAEKFGKIMDKQPPATRLDFMNGYQRAVDKKLFLGKEPAFWETTSTRIYIVLLLLIPVMHEIKSVSHLHRVLCVVLGESVIGRLNDVKQAKRLGKLCERIGLRFPRGRPLKVRPA